VQAADYAKFAAALAPAGQQCLKAALIKSKDAIANCTDTLSQACDNCHKVYRDQTQK
jgi:cytochrome c556